MHLPADVFDWMVFARCPKPHSCRACKKASKASGLRRGRKSNSFNTFPLVVVSASITSWSSLSKIPREKSCSTTFFASIFLEIYMRSFRSTSAFASSMTLPARADLFVWGKIPSSTPYIFVTLTVFITSRLNRFLGKHGSWFICACVMRSMPGNNIDFDPDTLSTCHVTGKNPYWFPSRSKSWIKT